MTNLPGRARARRFHLNECVIAHTVDVLRNLTATQRCRHKVLIA
jgi:hypothetical protein